MSRLRVFGRSRALKDKEATTSGQAASEERISTLEGELQVAVAEEAEAAQRFATDRQRRAALDQQLHEARRELIGEASQARNVLLEAEAAQRIAVLDAEEQELTHRLGVMDTIYDELQATLRLVAEAAIEELVEAQDGLDQLNPEEQHRPLSTSNSERLTSGSPSPDEVLESSQTTVGPLPPETQEEADRSVQEVGPEANGEQDGDDPQSESMPEVDERAEEEADVIIDDRDPVRRSSRYGRLLSLKRDRDALQKRARHDEATSNRFRRVLASGNVASADPQEVEARLRNMSHGTNSE